MRLFEAIVQANHAAPPGPDGKVTIPDGHASDLPVIALTCIDPRLNALLPERLGINEDQFIWLRNAGNIITGPLSSTMRSLALACAVKGGKEIAVIGHSDCQVCKTTVLRLTDALKVMGVERQHLPDNLVEYFGLFASERQNVMRGAEIVRSSPLIGSKVPVHGLLLDLANGRLEWVVNGYESHDSVASRLTSAIHRAEAVAADALASLPDLGTSPTALSELKPVDVKLPEIRIGSFKLDPNQWLSQVKTSEPEQPQTQAVVGDTASPEQDFDKTRRYKVIGRDQKVYGPIHGLKILQWLAEERIQWDTPSQLEGSSEWRPLGKWSDVIRRLPKGLPPRLPGQGTDRG